VPDQPTSSKPSNEGLDYRLHVPLLVHSVGIQTVVSLVRVTTSYRALELELSVVWLGVISASFALLPVFLGVFVGRYIDRGHDAQAAWIGNGVMLLGCAGLAVSPASALSLLAFNAVLGVGHIFLMAGHQMICIRSAGTGSREMALGNFLVAAAIGQGLGPFIIGWLGGGASIPPTQLLFNMGVGGIACMMLVSFTLRPGGRIGPHVEQGEVLSLSELFRIRSLPTLLVASVITITAQDLVVVYLPLLGIERGIDASQIGLLLTVRSAASMVARLLYIQLIYTVGRWPLMVASMLGSAATFVALALPLPLAVMYAVCAAMGFGLGIASTLSITSTVEVAPVQARATVMSMRISGNRVGQVVLPLFAGLVATAAGAVGVLVLIGLGLAASGAAVKFVAKSG
jgi:MFS family permease